MTTRGEALRAGRRLSGLVYVFGDKEQGPILRDEIRCTPEAPTHEDELPARVVVIYHPEAYIIGSGGAWCCPACGFSSLADAGSC